PATYTDATCRSCGACAQPHDAVIAFPAHGAWRLAEKATAARDVPVGESWAFREHRTMAEIIAEEKTATAWRLQPADPRGRQARGVGASRSRGRPVMCTFLLVWLVPAYVVSSRPGWFGALLV